jgi:hypothetical protein
MWYYIKDKKRFGPISKDKIADLIKSGVIGRRTLVWKSGMKNWVEAQRTALIDNSQKVRNVGLAQKLLIWAVLASTLVLITPYAFLLAVPFQFYCIYRLLSALERSKPEAVLYMVAMFMVAIFIPLGNLLFLLFLAHINGKATKYLRENSIRVGLIGAKNLPASTAESKRRSG